MLAVHSDRHQDSRFGVYGPRDAPERQTAAAWRPTSRGRLQVGASQHRR